MELFFSVIIPAFNMKAYIAEAIESALNQERVKFEIIVVNDGSTDNTLEIVKAFGDQIRIISQENMGQAAARNRGAREARGNVLAFLDADDIWFPDKLLIQSKKLLDGYVLVYTNRYNFGDAGYSVELLSDKITMSEGDIWIDLLFMNVISASSVVIIKNVFDELGGFRNDLPPCEDWDLWLRCAESHEFGYCAEPLLRYRIHPGGSSKKYVVMSNMREKVILSALNSNRGRKLSSILRRKSLARTWSTSAWGAASEKDPLQAFRFYGKALSIWPFDGSIWYDFARALTGRI